MSELDFNTAGQQRDVIPANTICTLHMTIRPGGAGDDGWLKRSSTSKGDSEGLDCEFTVVDGPYAKWKLWQLFTLHGTTPGHADAGDISMRTLRAIIESARGIRPDDKSAEAQAARKPSSWGDLDGLRFIARLGVRPPQDGWAAKNTIMEVITPGRRDWEKPPEQIAKPAAAAPTAPAPATTPPANAIARPKWGR